MDSPDRQYSERRISDRDLRKKVEDYFEKTDTLEKAIMGWRDPLTLQRHGGLWDLIEERDKGWAKKAKWFGVMTGIMASIVSGTIIFSLQQVYLRKTFGEHASFAKAKWRKTQRLAFRDPSSGRPIVGWLEERVDVP